MTTPLPKRFGYKLPLEALGGACVRVSLEFPDKLEYRAAFNGSINMLGKWFQWDHTQADYQDIPELNVEVAQVWSEVLADALWETCMDFCAQMIANAECFLDDASVQTEIINHLLNNQTFIQAINQIAGKGVPMPLPEIEAPVTDTCVEDNLFGGVTSIIRQMNTNNTDFFEKIEAGTNPIERAALIVSAIPIIETLPVDEIVEFTDQIIENIFENYDAEYTTALEDEYRCDIFCLALEAPDCSVTFDMLFEYFSGRLGGAITIESILAEGIAFVAAGTWSGTEIVDAMMLAQVVLWRAASNFLGINIRTLQTVGLLGQNNPDPDWSILCDCSTPPPPDPTLDVIQFSAWNDSCQWEFIEFEGSDEIWEVSMKPYPRSWSSFTGTPGAGIPFLVMDWDIISGSWTATAHEIDGINYSGGFPNDIPVTGYLAMFAESELGIVRFRFRPDPFD